MQYIDDLTEIHRGYRIEANLSIDPLGWKLIVSAHADTDNEEIVFSEGGFQDPAWAVACGRRWIDGGID